MNTKIEKNIWDSLGEVVDAYASVYNYILEAMRDDVEDGVIEQEEARDITNAATEVADALYKLLDLTENQK